MSNSAFVFAGGDDKLETRKRKNLRPNSKLNVLILTCSLRSTEFVLGLGFWHALNRKSNRLYSAQRAVEKLTGLKPRFGSPKSERKCAEVCGRVRRSARKCAEVCVRPLCADVCAGLRGSARGVRGSAWKCAECARKRAEARGVRGTVRFRVFG